VVGNYDNKHELRKIAYLKHCVDLFKAKLHQSIHIRRQNMFGICNLVWRHQGVVTMVNVVRVCNLSQCILCDWSSSLLERADFVGRLLVICPPRSRRLCIVMKVSGRNV
jgi:hypothetical protein